MEQAACYIKKGEPSWNRRFQCWKLSSFFRFSSNLLCWIFSTSSSPDVWCIKSESLTKEYLSVHDVFHISLLPLQTCVHIKQPLRFFSWEASETWEQKFQFHDNDLNHFKWRFLPRLENEQSIAFAILIKKPGKEPYFEMRLCVISTPFYISTFRSLLNMTTLRTQNTWNLKIAPFGYHWKVPGPFARFPPDICSSTNGCGETLVSPAISGNVVDTQRQDVARVNRFMSVYDLFNGCHVYSIFSFAGWGACFDLRRTWWRKSCRSSRSNQLTLATTERVQNRVLTRTRDLKIHVLSFWKSHHLKEVLILVPVLCDVPILSISFVSLMKIS